MAIKRFEIYDGADGKTYWRGVAGNNENVADGEGYEQWQGAAGCVELLLDIPPDVVIVDLTGGGRKEFTAEAFRKVVGGGRERSIFSSSLPEAEQRP